MQNATEIVKALRACDETVCPDCPLNEGDKDYVACTRRAADLIEQQEAELAALRKECGRLIDLAGDWKEAADGYHAERNTLKEAQRWIPVSERLPEDEDANGDIENVLILDVWEDMHVSFLRKGAWRGGCPMPMRNVTHWMPLPQPPEGEQNDE